MQFRSQKEIAKEVRANWPWVVRNGEAYRVLPSINEILSKYDLDRSIWRFRCKAYSSLSGRINTHGYRYLALCCQSWAEHRLIWKLETGCEPHGVIDHINGIRDDNRIENLRDVHPIVNGRNNHGDLWEREKQRRKAEARQARAAALEAKERATLARLKAKYEG